MVAHRDLDDGMVRIEAVLNPEEAAVVRAAIEREPATLPRKPRAHPLRSRRSLGRDGARDPRGARALTFERYVVK